MAAHRFQGPLGTSPVEIDQGTLCRNQSPVPGPIDAKRTIKQKSRPWADRDIDGYHEWVQKHGFEYVHNLTIDCADFAIYLLTKYAEEHALRLGFVASFSFRNPLASRRMVQPSMSDSMARLGAEDLFDVNSGNTVKINFQQLSSGDLLTSKVHVQIVMSKRSLVTVKDVVTKTSQTSVPVMEIVQGNLGSGKPVLVQRRAYDLRIKPDGTRNDSYYDYNAIENYYYPAGYSVDEIAEFQPRRWNFPRFNLML